MSGTNQDPAKDRDEQDGGFLANHPELADPRWQRRAERKAAKAALKQHKPVMPANHREMPRSWSPPEQGGYRPRRRFRVAWGWSITFTVLLVGGSLLWSHWDHGGGAIPLSGGQPTATVTTEQTDAPLDLNQPFANTPAAGWANGADGIVLPPAAPVGKWTAAQVADAENKVKQILVAAHLDNRMLINHDPSAYFALLAPNARSDEQKHLNDPSDRDDSRVTQLAPGFHLLPAPIKVSGSVSVATDDHGWILIHTNYVFAYPFAPANAAEIHQSSQIVAIHHIQDDFSIVQGNTVSVGDRGVWPGESQSYASQIDCAAFDQGLLGPDYANDRVHSGVETETPGAYFDPSHAMSVQDTCDH